MKVISGSSFITCIILTYKHFTKKKIYSSFTKNMF